MKIAIIGAGAAGSATARFAAREGHQVTIFEQFRLDHDRGSSYGPSRIIRRSYPDRLYSSLMDEAYRLWDGLEAEAGEELHVRSGGIFFGPRDHKDIVGTIDALEYTKTAFDLLAPDQARQRFPGMAFEADETVIYQDDGGFLLASNVVRAQVRLALAYGAEWRDETKVLELESKNGGTYLTYQDPDGLHHELFDRVAVTAGPWTRQFLAELDLPLETTRQHQIYVRPKPAPGPSPFAVGRFPVWIDARSGMYGFPLHDGSPGVKIAGLTHGDVIDPEGTERDVDLAHIEEVKRYMANRLPTLGVDVIDTKVCIFTNAPDEHFLLDAIPRLPGAFFASACSGHGFKFSILIGKILAEWLTDSPGDRPLGRFSFKRFLRV